MKASGKLKRTRVRRRDRGIALVVTMLILLLFTALTVGMIVSVNADMLINGYYRNSRSAFYAADSGLQLVRQDIANHLTSYISTNFTPGTNPMTNASPDSAAQTYASTTYGSSYTPLTGSGQAANSWPESFEVSNVSVVAGTPACAFTPLGPGTTGTSCSSYTMGTDGAQFTYKYLYTITSKGRSRGTELAQVTDTGTLYVNVNARPSTQQTTSFAAFGMFIDQGALCDGTTLVPGTITGRVHTNGTWNFGTSGNYNFTGYVTTHGTQLGYEWGSGASGCSASSANSYSGHNVNIHPSFLGGIDKNYAAMSLPTDSFNQKRAVIDGLGTSNSTVTNSDLASLRNVGNSQSPTTSSSCGVYLPYTTSSGVKTFTGGGIYVAGGASSVVLSPGSGTAQTYTITQSGCSPSSYRVTVDSTANTTTFTQGTGGSAQTTTIQGIPRNNSTGLPATMLYVDGNITALSGPGEGLTAVQDGTSLTVSAAGSVTITGDIRYDSTHEPVYLSQSGTHAAGDSTGDTAAGVLGIYTSDGNINLNNQQSSHNLEIDASLAALKAGAGYGLTNTGSTINTLNIVGGRIQNNIMNIGATTRNVFFDTRFANGVAPPFFPSTTYTPATDSTTAVSSTFQHTKWTNDTSYF